MILKEIAEQSKKWNRLSKKEKHIEANSFAYHCMWQTKSKSFRSENATKANIARWKQHNLEKGLKLACINKEISK